MPKPATYWWIIIRNGHPLDGTMRRTRKETIDNFLNRHPDAQITTWPTDWREWQDWGYAVARVTVEVQERERGKANNTPTPNGQASEPEGETK